MRHRESERVLNPSCVGMELHGWHYPSMSATLTLWIGTNIPRSLSISPPLPCLHYYTHIPLHKYTIPLQKKKTRHPPFSHHLSLMMLSYLTYSLTFSLSSLCVYTPSASTQLTSTVPLMSSLSRFTSSFLLSRAPLC